MRCSMLGQALHVVWIELEALLVDLLPVGFVVVEPLFLVLEADKAVLASADVTWQSISQCDAALVATVLELGGNFGRLERVVYETR